MTGNIYSFGFRQINILYYYIICTSLPTLTHQMLPSTSTPSFQTDEHKTQKLPCRSAPQVSSITPSSMHSKGLVLFPHYFPPLHTLFSPLGKPKPHINELTNFGLRSAHVELATPLFQDTCKLVPGLLSTRKMLVTQIRDLGGWIKDEVSGPHSGFK